MIRRNIPNALTCSNLVCGCMAFVYILDGDLVTACYLVGLALVFDFFDGFVARLLGVSSPIGKDLDSLADMVTFGAVPGIIMYKMIMLSRIYDAAFTVGLDDSAAVAFSEGHYWLSYTALLIPVFSAIRLAKFNNDPRQSDTFIGLPTPANAIFICSFPLIYNADQGHVAGSMMFNVKVMIMDPIFLGGISVVMSCLLVAEIPLLALKFKNFGWAGNKMRYIMILVAVVLAAFLKVAGIPLIILSYILLSLLNNFLSRNKKDEDQDDLPGDALGTPI